MRRICAALALATVALLGLTAGRVVRAQQPAGQQPAGQQPAGQQPAGQQPAGQRSPPAYRRIYVPHSDLSTQVRGLLPMKRDDFDRRMAAVHPASSESSLGPRITRAQYSAHLEGEDLVGGVARLDVANAHEGGGQLSLEPCNLALGGGEWDETPPRRAVLGIGPRDSLTLQVGEPGTVLLPWTRRGKKSPDGALEFELSLPPAPLQQLQLSLPSEVRLTSADGIVTRGEQQPGDDTCQWTVELGGIRRTMFRVEELSKSASPDKVALVKEQARYALTPTDLSVEFQLQVDVHGPPLADARLRIDPRLTITTVTLGGRAAQWSVAGDAQNRVLSVQFPDPLAVGSHSLIVQAVAEVATGRPWRLPRIRWPEAVWQEGTATLVVPSAVQLSVSRTSGCHMAKGVPSPAAAENLTFHYYSVDGFVEIAMLSRRPRLSAAVGITVQFDPAFQVSATLRADLVSQEGEVFEVDAVVSNDWVLDAIETSPPDLLEDRPVIAQDERNRTMRLKFVRPITPEHPVRLIARARFQQPSTDQFSARSLWRWFSFPDTIERPAVLALRNNVANYDLQVAGDGDASRIDPQASSGDDLDLLDSPPDGILFRLPPEAGDFRVVLRQGEPRFTAAWDVAALCSRNRLRQKVSVRCAPAGPGLSRLTVQSTPPPDREIRWSIAGGTDTTVVAQTRRDTPAGAGAPAVAEWELEFSRPLAQPFALESTWESPRLTRQGIPLFTCLKATSQTCLARVAAEDDARWFIEAEGLSAQPIPAQPPDRFTSERGLFRYEPQRPASLSVVDFGQESVVPLARASQAELTSRFAADGSALHLLSLSLVNAGLTELALNLPSTASLREVVVAGMAVEPQVSGSRNGNLRIRMPASERLVTVRITYATASQPRPLYAGQWRAELPALEIASPPLRWHLIMPPGMSTLDEVRHDSLPDQMLARFWGPLLPNQLWTELLHPWRSIEPHTSEAAESTNEQKINEGLQAELAIPAGWSLVSRDITWSPTVTTAVLQPGRRSLFSFTLTLLTCGLVLVTPWRWLSFWSLSSIVLAAGVMIVPLSVASLLAGAFWGLIAGCCAALLRPQAAASRVPQASRASTTQGWAATGASVAMLLTWLACGGHSHLQAQPPRDSSPTKKADQALRVVIPIDDNRQPVGDYVFVDAEFYDWLHAQLEGGQPGETWRIENASYDIHWPEEAGGEVAAAEVRARLEITTFSMDAAVTLPFRRQDLLLKQGGARLDGSPLAVSWQDDGQGLTATIATPGSYRLDLACSTPLKSAGQHRELSLAIPRAPHAVVRVSGATPFTAPSALGSLRSPEEAVDSTWQVHLGSTNELSLRSAAADIAGDQQPIEAEQFLSWRIRPGSVVVDAVCKFRALTGTLRGVQVRFDPRLRLLPLEGLPPMARHWVESGSENTLHVALAEPTAAIAIKPRFLLAESSGVGKIIPPRVEAAAGRIARNWLAVSTGAGVELAAVPQSAAKVPVADFAQAFGVLDGVPAAAFNLAGLAATPELEFRPADRTATAMAETTVTCSLSLCRLSFHAELTGLAPSHVQQRIVLPPGWTAADVSVRDGDLPLTSRWFQQADGTVVVRLDQPPGTSLQLRIDATLTPSVAIPLNLPAVQLADVAIAEHSLRVVRSYDCHVDIRQVAGWTANGLAVAGQTAEERRRWVASLDSAPSARGQHMSIRISANRPQVAARLVTRYARPNSSQALVSVVADLEITGGSLDELRLEAPPEWAGPWDAAPPLAIHTSGIPGQSRRFVTLTPDRPLVGKVRLSVSSPLRLVAGESPRVPEVTLVDVPEADRLVQLPRLDPGDASRWVTPFLKFVRLPAELQGGLLAEGEFETYRVTGPHFDAVLSTTPATTAEALVPLIEYRVVWQPAGTVQGRAIVHLDSSGHKSCMLDVGNDYHIVAVTLDGIPAEAAEQRDGRWLVHLPGDRLPLHLTVEFAGTPAMVPGGWSDRRLMTLNGPTVAGLPARATIWSVESPAPNAARSSRLGEESDLVRIDQDLARLTAAAEIFARASQRDFPGFSGDAMSAWLEPWRAEVAIASRRVSSALRTLVIDDGQRQARFRQVQTELERQLEKLQGGPLNGKDASSSAEKTQERVRLGGEFTGPVPQIEISMVDPAVVPLKQRWGAAAAVLLLGVFAWALSRLPAVRDWLAASAPFAAALGGIALAYLSPLGLAVLALPIAAMAASWRSPWPQRSRHRHSSVIRMPQRNAG